MRKEVFDAEAGDVFGIGADGWVVDCLCEENWVLQVKRLEEKYNC